jgi:DNA processing protein
MERYRAWLALHLLPDVGPARVNRLVRRFGSPEAVLEAPEAALREVESVGPMCIAALRDWRRLTDVDAELRLVEKHGVSLVSILDSHYPAALARVAVPPPLLYYRGTLEPLDEAAIAVIGSRKMSRYGREVGERIAGELGRAGVSVVSGLAIGIDGVAHRAALDAGGRTLAVLGCGLSRIYPAQHGELAAAVERSGAVISEMPMAAEPDVGSFPRRNAIIAWLSLGVVVIEAGSRSGTSITVGYALDESRAVFAVPGDVTRANSIGTNRLVREGARLVTSGRDVLADLRDELGRFLSNLPRTGDGDRADDPPPLPKELSDLERAIASALETDTLSIDDLRETLAAVDPAAPPAATGDLMSALLRLQLLGLVRQEPGMRFRRA